MDETTNPPSPDEGANIAQAPPQRIRPEDAATYAAPARPAAAPQRIDPAAAATYAGPTADAPGWLGNKADDDTLTGGAKNIVSSAIEGAHHVPGMFGDLVGMGIGVGASLASKYEQGAKALGVSDDAPRSRQEIEAKWKASFARDAQQRRAMFQEELKQPDLSDQRKRTLMKHLEKLGYNPEGLPPTGEELYKRAQSQLPGHYEAQTMPGRFVHSAVSAAVPAAVIPGLGVLQGARVGAVAGAASQGLTEVGVDDPLAHLAATVVAPAAVNKAFGAGRRAVFGMSAAEKEAAAAKILLRHTQDARKALAEALAREGLPPETLAEATLDPYNAKAQEIMLTRGAGPVVDAFQQYREAHNALLQQHLRSVGVNAAPEDVAAGFRAHQMKLEDEARAAQQAPAPTMSQTGEALYQKVHGEGGTGPVEHDRLTALKAAIDPDGKLGTWTGDLARYAKNDLADPQAAERGRGAVADELLKEAASFGDLKSWRSLDNFLYKINQTMAETKPGSADFNGLLKLKKEVERAQDQAIGNQHKVEASAVERGEMPVNETLAARLQQSVDDWRQNKGNGKGPPGYGERNLDPLDPATVAMQQEFKSGWKTYKETYKEGAVGAAGELHFGKPAQDYAKTAESSFLPGSKGEAVAKAWVAAGGEEAVQAMKDVATNRLQSEVAKTGKPLDQARLDSFVAKHADAMRVIDAADVAAGRPRFSETFFSDAASAQSRLKAFENGAAADFLGLKHPDDIVNTVGRMMSATDSATRTADLMAQVKSLPNGEAIAAGIRRSGAVWFENYLKNHGMTSGEGGKDAFSNSTKVKKFLTERADTLKQIFDPEAVANVEKWVDQTNRSISVRTHGMKNYGAQTAERTLAENSLNTHMDNALGIDARSGGLSVGTLLWADAFKSAAQLRFGEASQHAGMALLQGTFGKFFAGRGLQNKIDVTNLLGKALADRDFGAALLQKAVDGEGRPNLIAMDNMAKLLIASETENQRRQRLPKTYARTGRARGGRIVIDCAAKAAKLCREAEQIRKRHGGETKALLGLNDNAVADALSVANRSL